MIYKNSFDVLKDALLQLKDNGKGWLDHLKKENACQMGIMIAQHNPYVMVPISPVSDRYTSEVVVFPIGDWNEFRDAMLKANPPYEVKALLMALERK